MLGLALAAGSLGACGAEPITATSGARATSPCPRPYAATSPWNTPVGDAAPDQAAQPGVALIGGPLTSDPTQYTYPVYAAGRRTRRELVTVSGIFSRVTGPHRMTIRHGHVRIPWPRRARAAEGSDRQVIIVDRARGVEWGAWRAQRVAGRVTIVNGYRYGLHWSGVPPHDAHGRPFGSRGAGVPYLAGLVRPCEIARGRIDHALAFAYPYPRNTYVWPATKSDGRSTDPAALPEGTRLQLDPALTRADLEGRGCRDACLTIARAMQRYGMYVIDNSGRPKIMLEYQATAHWRGVDQHTVEPIPVSGLRVVPPPRRG